MFWLYLMLALIISGIVTSPFIALVYFIYTQYRKSLRQDEVDELYRIAALSSDSAHKEN